MSLFTITNSGLYSFPTRHSIPATAGSSTFFGVCLFFWLKPGPKFSLPSWRIWEPFLCDTWEALCFHTSLSIACFLLSAFYYLFLVMWGLAISIQFRWLYTYCLPHTPQKPDTFPRFMWLNEALTAGLPPCAGGYLHSTYHQTGYKWSSSKTQSYHLCSQTTHGTNFSRKQGQIKLTMQDVY